MVEPLKNIYTPKFVSKLIDVWQPILPKLKGDQFSKSIFTKDWTDLELKQRMSKLAEITSTYLPSDFKKAAPIIRQLITSLAATDLPIGSYEYMFIPEIVERSGINHWQESMDTIECVTAYTSCEFAIRPFIIKYEDNTMKQMLIWSKNQHQNVRRLSTEGCRSRLPWAMALPRFKKDTTLILPILNNLKADESLFVRKSVANNLNDISKDHPNLALQLAKKWNKTNEYSSWIVKHGMRTLLKAGEPKAMLLFGYADLKDLVIGNFNLHSNEINFGESIQFDFSIKNKSKITALIRMEFAVYFMKNNGQQTKKVFKVSEREVKPDETLTMEKSHPIKPINTRKYYPGEHGVALIINGVEFEKHLFLLNM